MTEKKSVVEITERQELARLITKYGYSDTDQNGQIVIYTGLAWDQDDNLVALSWDENDEITTNPID